MASRPAALLLLPLALAAACSADPVRARVWETYQRELVRLEADGSVDERVALARRGVADPDAGADDRCRFHLEAARALRDGGRGDEARAEIVAARSPDAPPECVERADLAALRLDRTASGARRFLADHPRSSVYAAVLGDLLHGLDPSAALAQLDDLQAHTADVDALHLLRYEQARRLAGPSPERALGLYDAVADEHRARSADAAVEAVGLLVQLQRFQAVQGRFDATDDEAVAWAACRGLERDPAAGVTGRVCLQAFADRFPTSRKVDDAWFFLAAAAERDGDLPTALALYRRIVDERPDAGRATQAQRRLEELRSPTRP